MLGYQEACEVLKFYSGSNYKLTRPMSSDIYSDSQLSNYIESDDFDGLDLIIPDSKSGVEYQLSLGSCRGLWVAMNVANCEFISEGASLEELTKEIMEHAVETNSPIDEFVRITKNE